MIRHGGPDPLVPHAQGELPYPALKTVCHDTVFFRLPLGEHRDWDRMLTAPAPAAATRPSTASIGCAVQELEAVRRAWRTLTCAALVDVWHAWPGRADGYAWRVSVSGTGFSVCARRQHEGPREL